MSDALRALYDSYTTEADLRGAVEQGREEGLYLEFKTKQDSTDSGLGDDDRKNFSKALSAFANAAGGVLIFGVKTTKGAEHPDRASALKPISSAAGFMVRLKDLVLSTTQPVVDDVEFRFFPSGSDPRAGYVACLVPASDKPPHRAMHAGREYYRRTETGCRKLEHLDLEDMFGRRPRPVLSLRVELRQTLGDSTEDLYVFLLNEGRTVARYPGLLATVLDPGAVLAGGDGELQDVSYLNGAPCFQFSDSVGVIHPNGILRALGRIFVRRPERGGPLKIHVKWYCDGMRAKDAVFDVVSEQRVVVR